MGGARAQVSVIGQGTWMMESNPRKDCVAALRSGLDHGLTHVDTAEMYGSGRVEEIVGAALVGRRHEAFLASKVLPTNASFEGTLRACEESLSRLKTDYLDLYLLHWPSSHPLRDTMRAFEQLQRDGKIRAFGVSNFDVSDLEAAIEIVGEGKIACNQVLYHLDERSIEHRVLPWCERHNVSVVGYSPFGSGRFANESTARGKVLRAIADAHATTARCVALAFLVRRPSLFTIPKAATLGHVEDNARALSLALTADDVARIEVAFPLGDAPDILPTL
ncbi:MAG: aldo/keto reductase [Polyangiales bacterium]